MTLPTALQVALARADALQAIPPITDPMGKNWEQPDRREILIDDTHALMSTSAFNRLHEYSATFPTGAYEGKMWKRHNGIFDRDFLRRGGKPEWMLVWYGKSDKPGFVSNNLRLILLTDGELPA
jgi:hypothetical protein